MRRPPVFALIAALVMSAQLVACDKPSSSTNTPPEAVGEFHISIFNACGNDVTVEVGAQPGGGKQVHLFKDARETITGNSEQVFLMGKGGEVLATYQPRAGKQKAQVSSDCTAIERLD